MHLALSLLDHQRFCPERESCTWLLFQGSSLWLLLGVRLQWKWLLGETGAMQKSLKLPSHVLKRPHR